MTSLISAPAPCPDCGAPCATDEAFCWMCHRRLWDKSAPPAPKLVPPPPPPAPVRRDLEAAAPTINLTLILVVVGAWFIGRAIGVIIALMVMPAFVTRPASPKGVPGQRPPPPPRTIMEHVLAAFRILAVTAVIMAFIAIALLFALYATCLFILGAASSH